MKKYILIILMVMNFVNSISQELTFMTYNIRLDVAADGENAWPNRKANLVSQIKFYDPDIFGVQEAMPHQVNFIDQYLSSYSFIGQGRDGENKGEYSALYFNYKKFDVEQQGTFWLSENPNEVSIGWDAAFPRICTYGLFIEKKSGIKFYVFNTHLDHVGEISRYKSLEFILKKIKDINAENLSVVLMGDFNLEPESKEIAIASKVMDDTKKISVEASFGPEGTFNAFKFESNPTKRIDYIFVSKSKIKVQKYGVLNNSFNLRYPSDHFPVYVEVKIN